MKKIIKLPLALVTALSLTACAAPAPTATKAPAASREKETTAAATTAEKTAAASGEAVTLKCSTWDIATNVAMSAFKEAFEAENPDIKIELIDTPSSDYTTKLSVMLNGGSDLDVFFVKDGDTTKGLYEKGQLADLSPYIEASAVDLTKYNGLANNFKSEDATYAMPVNSNFYVLFYNKDIFDAANISYPSNDMTWKEFEETARKLTSGSGAEKKYGALFHTWNACVQNWGVADGKHTIMDTDLGFMKESYEMVLRMQNEDKSCMDYATLKTGNLHYSSLFMQGNVAMLPMGTFFVSQMINKVKSGETEVNWGMATLPHAEGVEAGYTVGSVTPVCINEASKKKDAAWRYVEFVSSEKGAKILAELGAIAACGNDETRQILSEVDGMPEGSLEAFAVKNVSLDRPINSKVGEVNQMLDEQHSLIMLGEIAVDEGIALMEEYTKEIQEK